MAQLPFKERVPLKKMSIVGLGKDNPKPITVLFNPKDYTLEQSNTYAEIGIPGLEAPVLQFVRGNVEKLSLELLIDTTDEEMGKPARDAGQHADAILALSRVDSERHAPPLVRFEWDKNVVEGVIESVRRQFVLFDPTGVPTRIMVSLSVKRYRSVVEQLGKMNTKSPDRTRTVVVVEGDTLPAIAHRAYGDESQWRKIVEHPKNNIEDPADIRPGQVLQIPKIEKPRGER